MVPIISIVGISDSGKTTLIEKLLPEFKRRGYRVGTVKHHSHEFDIDKEGKDSWRHTMAGSDTVVIASPQKLAMVKKMTTDMSLENMREALFSDVDLIIAEGYKRSTHPKLEVLRTGVHEKPLCNKKNNLLAIISDIHVDIDVPCFGLEDIIPLIDFLEETILEKHSIR